MPTLVTDSITSSTSDSITSSGRGYGVMVLDLEPARPNKNQTHLTYLPDPQDLPSLFVLTYPLTWFTHVPSVYYPPTRLTSLNWQANFKNQKITSLNLQTNFLSPQITLHSTDTANITIFTSFKSRQYRPNWQSRQCRQCRQCRQFGQYRQCRQLVQYIQFGQILYYVKLCYIP